jgi:hypothetical protein
MTIRLSTALQPQVLAIDKAVRNIVKHQQPVGIYRPDVGVLAVGVFKMSVSRRLGVQQHHLDGGKRMHWQ